MQGTITSIDEVRIESQTIGRLEYAAVVIEVSVRVPHGHNELRVVLNDEMTRERVDVENFSGEPADRTATLEYGFEQIDWVPGDPTELTLHHYNIGREADRGWRDDDAVWLTGQIADAAGVGGPDDARVDDLVARVDDLEARLEALERRHDGTTR